MADQTFAVTCGFFDSVNQDRLYNAEDMNKPYKRIVADGVFATPAGSPSTDLQVLSVSGMTILVKAGEGIFGHKWFSNDTDLSITVPANSALNGRIDSVIAQIDRRASGRVGNIVYRTGTPAANPVPPEINTEEGVTEYRIANISVASNASFISQSNITDLRGSSSCPWVTGLIKQVDTSTLFTQWQSAYQRYYESAVREAEDFQTEQTEAWDEWFSSLSQQLTNTMSIVTYDNSVAIGAEGQTNVVIGISSFDYSTDVLEVFINGLLATSAEWSLASDHISVDLVNGMSIGDVIGFRVLKAVNAGPLSNVVDIIKKIDQKVNNFTSDTGWMECTLADGVSAYSANLKPAVRIIGNRVYMRGAVKGTFTTYKTLFTIPAEACPAENRQFASYACIVGNTNTNVPVEIEVRASGIVQLGSMSGPISDSQLISVDSSWLSATGASYPEVFRLMGSVNTYADLPASPLAGDVYTVMTADSTHGIEAGDQVVWNGFSWEIYIPADEQTIFSKKGYTFQSVVSDLNTVMTEQSIGSVRMCQYSNTATSHRPSNDSGICISGRNTGSGGYGWQIALTNNGFYWRKYSDGGFQSWTSLT